MNDELQIMIVAHLSNVKSHILFTYTLS